MNPENNYNPNPPQPTDPNQPLAQPVPPAAPGQPVPPAQPAQPAPDPTTQGIQGQPTTLGVSMMSPTHFDNQNTVHPIINNPGMPMDPNAPVKPEKPAKPQLPPEEKAKRFMILSIVAGSIAVVMLGVAIWGIVSSVSNADKLSKANEDLANKNAIVATMEESVCADAGDGESSICPIDSPDKVPVYKTTQGYIYITEWNIKLKIPDDLTSVSYILDQKYRPSICFNALKKGVQYFPAFADVAQNPGGMGCLTRVATTEGNTAAETGISFGTKVFTYKEYSYFYTAPAKVFSTDAAEQGLEATAVQIIKNMVTDNISQYE